MIRSHRLIAAVLFVIAPAVVFAGGRSEADTSILPDTPIPVSALHDDLALFRTAIEEAHAGLDRYLGREEFERLVSQADAMITGPMTQEEFYRLLEPVVVAIRDGHTKFHVDTVWSGYSYFNRDRQIPLRLYVVDDRAWVRDDAPGITAGSEVVSINGTPVAAIIGQLIAASGFADGNGPGARRLDVGDLFPAYYGNFIGASDRYEVITVPPGSDRSSTTLLSAMPLDQLPFVYDPAIEGTGLELTFPRPDTAVLRVATFGPESGTRSFQRELASIFSTVIDAAPQRLVIDIRDNEGGTDALGTLLFSYIAREPYWYYDRIEATQRDAFSVADSMDLPWFFSIYRSLLRVRDDGKVVWPYKRETRIQQPQHTTYAGDVVVLTNGRTFSVAAEFAAIARSTGRARFIGEETGGAYGGNTSGFFAITHLPNAHLIVGIPVWGYYLAVLPVQGLDCGVIPDLVVVPSIDDLLAGDDPALQAALDLQSL